MVAFGGVTALKGDKSTARRRQRGHSSELKAKVAITVLQGDKTLAEQGQQFGVHPNQITDRKAPIAGALGNSLRENAGQDGKMNGTQSGVGEGEGGAGWDLTG